MSLEHSPGRRCRNGNGDSGSSKSTRRWAPEDLAGPITLEDDRVYRERQAAILLNRSPSSLAKDRVYGRGCPYIKNGATVGYLGADIRAYRALQRRRSTSENVGA